MGDETVLKNLNGVSLAIRAEPDLLGRFKRSYGFWSRFSLGATSMVP